MSSGEAHSPGARLTPNSDSARIVISRDDDPFGYGQPLWIHIDGRLAGKVFRNETARLPVAPGEHRVHCRMAVFDTPAVRVAVGPGEEWSGVCRSRLSDARTLSFLCYALLLSRHVFVLRESSTVDPSVPELPGPAPLRSVPALFLMSAALGLAGLALGSGVIQLATLVWSRLGQVWLQAAMFAPVAGLLIGFGIAVPHLGDRHKGFRVASTLLAVPLGGCATYLAYFITSRTWQKHASTEGFLSRLLDPAAWPKLSYVDGGRGPVGQVEWTHWVLAGVLVAPFVFAVLSGLALPRPDRRRASAAA